MARPVCLSHAVGCGVCQDRQADSRPDGWLPHYTDPAAVERLLGPEPAAGAGGGIEVEAGLWLRFTASTTGPC